MNIVSFKMITGEELIAELKSTIFQVGAEIPEFYVVRKPHVFQIQRTSGGLGLAFIPWTLSNPDIDTLQVPASSVLVTFPPSAKVEEQYIQQTSSIQIAKTI